MISILHEDLGLIEIQSTFQELLPTLENVSIRSEEHQDAAPNIALQLEQETSQISEGLLHITILKVKLEFVASEI